MYANGRENNAPSSEDLMRFYDCLKYISDRNAQSYSNFPKAEQNPPMNLVDKIKEMGGLIPNSETKLNFKRATHDESPQIFNELKSGIGPFKTKSEAPGPKSTGKPKRAHQIYQNENEDFRNVKHTRELGKTGKNSKFYDHRLQLNFLPKGGLEDMIKSSRFGNSLKTGHFEDSTHTLQHELANQTHGFSQFFVPDQPQKSPMRTPQLVTHAQAKRGSWVGNQAQVWLARSLKKVFKYSLNFEFKMKSAKSSQKGLVVEMFENVEGPSADFVMRLSDPSDLEFLLVGVISKEEFYHMKKEQNLRLEYGELGCKLEEMIQLCLKKPSTETKDVQHRAVLEMHEHTPQNKATFRIVQENEFRESDHISIGLVEADEKVLVKYLSERLGNEITRRQEREREGIALCQAASALQAKVAQLEADLDQMSKQRQADRNEAETEMQEKVEREENARRESETQLKSTLAEVERMNGQLRAKLEKAKGELGQSRREAKEVKAELEKVEKETKEKSQEQSQKLSELEEADKAKKEELERKKEQIKDMEMKIAIMNAENQKNEERIRESHELKKEAWKNAETHMKIGEESQETIKELRAQKEKLKGKLIECTQEIGQLAKILAKMEEKKEDWQRRKKQVQESLREERELGRRTREILIEKEKQLAQANEEKTLLGQKLREQENRVQDFQSRLKEHQENQQVNKQIIDFLNTRVEETQTPFGGTSLGTRGLDSRGLSKCFGSTTNLGRYRSRDLQRGAHAREILGNYGKDRTGKWGGTGDMRRTNVDAVLEKYAGISGKKTVKADLVNSGISTKYGEVNEKTGELVT